MFTRLVQFVVHRRKFSFAALVIGAAACGSGAQKPGASQAPAPAAATGASAAELVYAGAPIHPACVAAVVSEKSVSLAECSKAVGEVTARGKDAWTFEPAPTEDTDGREMTEYQRLGPLGVSQAVMVVENTGGTGYFSTVALVRVNGDKLELLQTVGAGDRCNGGITGAQRGEDGIEFSIFLTPPDIIDLDPAGKQLKIEAYSDLEASAASCAATASYVWKSSAAQPELIAVDLGTDEVESAAGWTDGYKFQACFNQLSNEWRKTGRAKLDSKALSAFVSEFSTRCVKR